MVDSDYIRFCSLQKEEFNRWQEILYYDKSVSKYVSFSYEALVTKGIYYKNSFVGMFNLNYFIRNSLALSIGILEEYRKLGIGKATFYKIVELYGPIFSNVDLFVVNVLPNNENAIVAFRKMKLKQTHEFDEMMYEEGAEFFLIFYEENPYRKLVKNDRT